MKYKSKMRFSTTVTVNGSNVYVTCDKGKTVDLEPAVADLVNRDVGSKILTKVAKPKKKAPAKGKKPAKNAKTSAVTKAHNR